MLRGLLLAGFLSANLLLAGCTNLPVDGPSHRDIEGLATASLVSEEDRPRVASRQYALVDLTDTVLAEIPRIGPVSFFRSFGSARWAAPSEIRMGPGDRVEVTIFESANGGLFSPGESSLRPGNFVAVPTQTVSQDGIITVPYAGNVILTGKTAQEAQKEIESKLSARAIEPQVVLTVGEQVASTVTVVGQSSSKVPLRGNERVLDVIATAGGTKDPGHELFVTLVRRGRSATVYFPILVRNPRENVRVAPGDIVYIYREQQKFMAFGAVGSGTQTQGLTGLFPFEDENLSLSEAIARAGGLLDDRAHAAVFVYRMEPRDALEHMGVGLSAFAGRELVPTIYRLNFRDPSAFFLAQNFRMRHKDAIYVANSDSVELEKFLAHTTAITSTVSGVATDALVTRDAVRALRN